MGKCTVCGYDNKALMAGVEPCPHCGGFHCLNCHQVVV